MSLGPAYTKLAAITAAQSYPQYSEVHGYGGMGTGDHEDLFKPSNSSNTLAMYNSTSACSNGDDFDCGSDLGNLDMGDSSTSYQVYPQVQKELVDNLVPLLTQIVLSISSGITSEHVDLSDPAFREALQYFLRTTIQKIEICIVSTRTAESEPLVGTSTGKQNANSSNTEFGSLSPSPSHDSCLAEIFSRPSNRPSSFLQSWDIWFQQVLGDLVSRSVIDGQVDENIDVIRRSINQGAAASLD
ncbi:hypothetical protein DL96DRAFT_1658812 [Flagelloscypha sp. PMI_526]|nr:hypothetical protein DL96DRAFT_1658812 [Flagelloscypha sp. PMI_526]